MRKSAPLILFSLVLNLGIAQTHKLQSVFIYSFTRHVIWPEDYNHGDFEILVLGDSPILTELREIEQTKKVNGRPIKVTQIADVGAIRKCNILYIGADRSAQFREAMARVGKQAILVVTEEPGLGAQGSGINFITKDDKLVFELNQSAIGKQNLKVSNTLTSMAILI